MSKSIYGLKEADTLTFLLNAAFHPEKEGEFANAEELYGEDFSGREVLGPEHEDTLPVEIARSNGETRRVWGTSKSG